MIIDGRTIGYGEPPYIIAEISCNHSGRLERALELIELAARAGADAVKFQCYTPDTITANIRNNPDFIVKGGPWAGRHLYDLYEETQTPFAWFPELFERARKVGITLLSSTFDKSSVDLLETLGCPAYKIASMEITNIPLIQYAAKTGKPLIISTGMASYQEIGDALIQIQQPYKRTAILHCISGYPTPIEEADLGGIRFLQNCFSEPIGISDHTKGWEIPIAATVLGASIIEKHFIGWDGYSEDKEFSLNPTEFETMCQKVRAIWKAMQPSVAKSEESSRQMRQSLYVVKNVNKGENFTESNVRSIRPCYGLSPTHLPDIVGKRAASDIEAGTALAWNLVDQAS